MRVHVDRDPQQLVLVETRNSWTDLEPPSGKRTREAAALEDSKHMKVQKMRSEPAVNQSVAAQWETLAR